MTLTSDTKQDRHALLLFAALTMAFCTGAYVPILTGGGFDALGGYALLLLMVSPGCAGVVTSLVMYRSLTPLGLTGNRQTLYWVLACIALPIGYALLIKWGLAATGMISLGGGDLPVAFLVFTGLFLSLRNALGEELGWRGFAAPLVTRVFGCRLSLWRRRKTVAVSSLPGSPAFNGNHHRSYQIDKRGIGDAK